eukprot:4115996-Pyramimonas_sp.AAC.1
MKRLSSTDASRAMMLHHASWQKCSAQFHPSGITKISGTTSMSSPMPSNRSTRFATHGRVKAWE